MPSFEHCTSNVITIRVELVPMRQRVAIRQPGREQSLLRRIGPARVAPDLGFLAQAFHRVVERLAA